MKTKFKFFLLFSMLMLGLRSQSQCNVILYYTTVDSAGVINFWMYLPYVSDGHTILCEWNFGDGNYASGVNDTSATHTYASSGTYPVCVTIMDSTIGCQASTCDTVVINHCAGAADFGANVVGFGDYSFTPVNIQNFGGATAYWTFGDGSNSNLTNTIHQYTATGTYNVCLYVSDAALGCADTFCTSYSVDVCGDYVNWIDTAIRAIGPLQLFVTPNTINPAYNYSWAFGDGGVSTADTLTHTYNNTATYTITLVTSDPSLGCSYSTYRNIFSDHCGLQNNDFYITENDLSVSLAAHTGYLDSMSQFQYQYLWSFAGGTSQTDTGLSINVTYANYGTYTVCLTTTTPSACMDTFCETFTLSQPPPPPPTLYQIGGQVLENGGGACGVVYLIAQDTVGHLALLDSMLSSNWDSAGQCSYFLYEFTNLPADTYYIKAALDVADPHYANYLPTYYGDVLHWANATPVIVGPNNLGNININLGAGANPGGPGFIGGWVSQGAGIVAHGTENNNEKSVGQPLVGIQINLLTIGNQAVAYAYTDSLGHYQFPGLEYGTYQVYAEVLNKTAVPIIITISAETPADSTANISINSHTATAIDEVIDLGTIGIYPNPVSSNLQVRLKTNQSASGSLKLLNVLGQTAFERQLNFVSGENIEEINMQKLPAGVYELVIAIANKQVSYKIVKTQ